LTAEALVVSGLLSANEIRAHKAREAAAARAGIPSHATNMWGADLEHITVSTAADSIRITQSNAAYVRANRDTATGELRALTFEGLFEPPWNC
jgi:hypothetical protein